MADNIKYIRWAAKVLKIVIVINFVIGFARMSMTAGLVAFTVNKGTVPAGIITISIDFIGIIIYAFILYTAARGLELLADVGYHLLITWHKQQGINS